MFVLMNLMKHCLQRVYVLFDGMHQPSAPIKWAQVAIISVANPTSNPIAPLHAPTPRLMI